MMRFNKWQFIGICLAILTCPIVFLLSLHGHSDPTVVIILSPFISLFVLGVWLAIAGQSHDQRGLIRTSLIIGFVTGCIAFVLGYIGPLVYGVLTGQDVSQGPLLGIFFTGPLGFAVGIIVGIPIAFIMKTNRKKQEIQ